MSKKGILSTVIALLLLISAMAGCGGAPAAPAAPATTKAEPAATTAAAETTAAAQTTTAAAAETKAAETKAAETTTAAKAEPAADKTVYPLKIMVPMNPNPEILFTEREQYPVWGLFKEQMAKWGVAPEFEIIPRDQYELVVQTRMASASDLPDIANITQLDIFTAINLGASGILQDVNAILAKPEAKPAKDWLSANADFMFKYQTTPEGQMYWITSLFKIRAGESDWRSTAQVQCIRSDWLKAAGLDTPKTPDDFYNALKAFRENDANGNGVQDEVLVLDPKSFANGIAQWYGLGSYVATIDLYANKAVSPWYQPCIKDYFKFLIKLTEEGILDTSLIGVPFEQVDQKVASNMVSSIYTYCMQSWLEPSISNPNTEPVYLPIALNDPATGRATPALNEEPPFLSWNRWAFTNKCNPDAAAAYLNLIYNDDYWTLSEFGVEGDTYDVVNGEKVLRTMPPWAEMAANKISNLAALSANSILPSIRFTKIEIEMGQRREQGWDVKSDFQEAILKYPVSYPDTDEAYKAIPTEQQLNEKNALMTDIKTYSEELATKLVLGQASLEKWDEYMADFDRLGLPRLLEIEQELHDAFNKFK